MQGNKYEEAAPTETVRVYSVGANEEPTLGDLFGQLASDLSSLVRKEIELARAETQEKLAHATRSAVTMVAGGLVAYAGLIMLFAAVAVWLGGYMDLWLAVLIVGVVVLIVGAVLIGVGRSALANVSVVPENTIESLKQDAQWAKEQIQ